MRNQLSCIEAGKRYDLDFGESELFLYDGPDSPQLCGMDGCSEVRG